MSDIGEQDPIERLAAATDWALDKVIAVDALILLSELRELGLADEAMGRRLREDTRTQAAFSLLANLAVANSGYEPLPGVAQMTHPDPADLAPAQQDTAIKPNHEDEASADHDDSSEPGIFTVKLIGDAVEVGNRHATLSEDTFHLLHTLLRSNAPLSRTELALSYDAFKVARAELNLIFREATGLEAIMTVGAGRTTRYEVNPRLALIAEAADDAQNSKKN